MPSAGLDCVISSRGPCSGFRRRQGCRLENAFFAEIRGAFIVQMCQNAFFFHCNIVLFICLFIYFIHLFIYFSAKKNAGEFSAVALGTGSPLLVMVGDMTSSSHQPLAITSQQISLQMVEGAEYLDNIPHGTSIPHATVNHS